MNLYIELIGPACIGKTTIAKELEAHPAFKSSIIHNSTKNKVSLTLLKPQKLKLLLKLFFYLNKRQKASITNSLRRAYFILNTPNRKEVKEENYIVIIDQGPIGAVSSVAIKGKEWTPLCKHVKPNPDKWTSIFVFLSISEEEHNIRKKKRKNARKGNPKFDESKIRNKIRDFIRGKHGKTGKEQVNIEERYSCYRFWESELNNCGARALNVFLDDFTNKQIADMIIEEAGKK